MNVGVFQTQLGAVWQTIIDLGLDWDRTWHPDYSLSGATYFRHLTYVDIWKTCLREQFYDFQLIDNSLIQFRVLNFSPLSATYVYYECPFRCVSYFEFLANEGFDYAEVRDELSAEYDLYVTTTCDLKETVTPIRCDFSPELYNEGLHPASHIHFGHSNQIRVGTKKVLRPLSFLLFILRQCYPQSWQKFVASANAELMCRNVRDNLDDVEGKYFQTLDQWEMSLI